MKSWTVYILIIVGTYAVVLLLHWALKHNKEELDEIFLNSVALAIPMCISNCFIYKVNQVVNKTKK